jgi:beta-glucosidase
MRVFTVIAGAAALAAALATRVPSRPPKRAHAPYERQRFSGRVETLLSELTLQQQIGQMTQLDLSMILIEGTYEINVPALTALMDDFAVGSFLNVPGAGDGNTPCPNVSAWQAMQTAIQAVATTHGSKLPIVYGLDSVHGANYVYNSSIWPQPLAVAATFNRSVAGAMAATAAKDTRASDIPWIFAPILGVMSHHEWPRCYETFGECPYLASELATASICGAQGCPANLSSPLTAAATMKHFIGYPYPRSGQDRTPAWIPYRHLLNYYLPPFQAAVDAGVATTMESYSETEGVPMASSALFLSDLLRGQMNFSGVLVTDWAEIENQYDFHHVASSPLDAVYRSINRTSIDMSMVPVDTSFATLLANLTSTGGIDLERVAESAGRILTLKENLGLLDEWVDGRRVETPERAAVRADVAASVGSAADRAAALDAARQAVVLLQNRGATLPLNAVRQGKHGSLLNVLLIGPSADSITNQVGGWTIHWQGAAESELPYGTTLLDGLQSLSAAFNLSIKYEVGCDTLGNQNATSLANIQALLSSWADVVVMAGGEPPYAELPGDIQDLTLYPGQISLGMLAANTSVPSVLVLFEGRARLLGTLPAVFSAVVDGLLTGPDAGQAVAEVLLGVTVPSGRLPFSYPSVSGNEQVHYWHTYPDAVNFDPLWAFGTGLSYTNFTYSQLQLNASSITISQLQAGPLSASVRVTNAGAVTASTSVLFYLSDLYRSVTPEVKMLKGFDRVGPLAPGTSAVVTVQLDAAAFAFWNEDEPPAWIIEPGDFVVSLQDSPLVANLTVVDE